MTLFSCNNLHSRLAGWVLLVCISHVLPLSAQVNSAEPRKELTGNPLKRIFYKDFQAPVIRKFEPGRDDSLQSMVREGRLQLAEADVVRLVLQNNVDVNVERYTPYFNAWEVTKQRAVLNPLILFSTNVDRLVTPSTNVLQGGDTLLNLNTLYDLTIRKPFENGTDIELNYYTRRLRTSNFFDSVNPAIVSNLGVTFTQHLLKDSGSISRGRLLRIAKNNLGMSQEDFVARTSDILGNALNIYWDLVFNAADIQVKEGAMKLAETVLEQNKIQLEAGTMTRLDVVEAEAVLATQNEQLVAARHNYRLTADQLKKLISSQSDPGMLLEPLEAVSAVTPRTPSNDITRAIQRAMETRPEIKQLLMDLESKQIQIDYTRNQLLPSLDLVANYSQNGLGGPRTLRDFSASLLNPPIISVQEGGFWDSLDGLVSRKYLGYTMGFTLRVPIGNDEARANNAQAQIAYRQGEGRLRSLRQKIAIEVREAYERMEISKARMAAAESTVRFNETRLQGEQDKYSLEHSTSRYLLQAQGLLADAQSRLLRAKVDLIKSGIAVDRAVGEIFQTYNIEVQGALDPSR